MIFAALLLLTPAAGPAAAATAEPEIVVMAEKLKTWRGAWRKRDGAFECRTTRSTGDREMDAVGCHALQVCVTPHMAAMQAIADSKEVKAAKNQRLNALMQSTLPCLDVERRDGIAELYARRKS